MVTEQSLDEVVDLRIAPDAKRRLGRKRPRLRAEGDQLAEEERLQILVFLPVPQNDDVLVFMVLALEFLDLTI